MNTTKFSATIIKIILLTNLFAIPILFTDIKMAIGWIAGTIASSINFYFMARTATMMVDEEDNPAKIKTMKGFYLRYIALISYVLAVMFFLKPDVLCFGVALFSAQFTIVLYQVWCLISESRWSKYFRR